MGNQTRFVIGSEVNDDRKVELDQLGSKVAVPVSLYDSSGNQINIGAGLVTSAFDSLYATYPDDVSEVYTYKLAGVVVNIITVIYSSSAKTNLVSVVKT